MTARTDLISTPIEILGIVDMLLKQDTVSILQHDRDGDWKHRNVTLDSDDPVQKTERNKFQGHLRPLQGKEKGSN